MSRAYIAGIGTTGVLVAAILMLLTVVSTLVAFQGLPEQDVPDEIRSYVVDEPSGSGAVPAAAQRSAPEVASRAADVAGPRTGARGSSSPATPTERAADAETSGGSGAPRAEPAPRRQATSDPVRRRAPAQQDPPARRAPRPEQPRSFEPPSGDLPRNGANTLGGALGDATSELTKPLGSLLAPISPSLGAQIQGTGDSLAQQLRDLGSR